MQTCFSKETKILMIQVVPFWMMRAGLLILSSSVVMSAIMFFFFFFDVDLFCPANVDMCCGTFEWFLS